MTFLRLRCSGANYYLRAFMSGKRRSFNCSSAPPVELRLIQAGLCFSKAWNKPHSQFAGAILVPSSAS